jgi:hypothetical protein
MPDFAHRGREVERRPVEDISSLRSRLERIRVLIPTLDLERHLAVLPLIGLREQANRLETVNAEDVRVLVPLLREVLPRHAVDDELRLIVTVLDH